MNIRRGCRIPGNAAIFAVVLIYILFAQLPLYGFAELSLSEPHFVDPDHIVCSIESRSGLFLLDRANNTICILSNSRGSGRYVFVSTQGTISYKEVKGTGKAMRQRACFYDIALNKPLFHSPWYPLCGNPSFSVNGKKAFSIGDTMLVFNNADITYIPIGHYVNTSPLAPYGNALVYNDIHDQLWLYDLEMKKNTRITHGVEGSMLPFWAPCNDKILFSSLSGELFVYFVAGDSIISIGAGCHARWIDENQIIYVVQTVEQYELIASDIARYDLPSGERQIFTTPEEFEIEPCALDSMVLYISLTDGALYEARLHEAVIRSRALVLERSDIPLCGDKVRGDERANIILNIPYLHQLYDTKDAFNGSWACGPTSCMMAVQSYNMLPNWSSVCTWPYEHMSLFGRYISDVYTYNGITYDWMSLDPNNNPAYGAYGYICPFGGAVWANMEQFNNWHNLTSYMDVTPTWGEYLLEIDNGYPVVISTQLTTAGHIVLGKGYVENQHTMITNDPYGDKNLGYTNYYGSGAFYDWPGYNNGYENLNQVKVYIGAQYVFPPTVRIFDDLDEVFSYTGNWLERSGGYNMHAYYTDAAVQGDTAFWSIALSQPDSISVFTEFYRGGNRVKNASFLVAHYAGTTVTTVDQRGYGLSGWYDLGTYFFEDSVVVGATDTGSDSSGIVLADAVMLVFHNATGISSSPPLVKDQIQVFPNPFSTATTIHLSGIAHGAENIELKIYDTSGRRVREFILYPSSFILPAKLTWDRTNDAGKAVAPGVYFIKIKAGMKTYCKKIVLL